MNFKEIEKLEKQYGYNSIVQEEYHRYHSERQKSFADVKSKLSKKFIKIYEQNDCFHDWNVDSICYQIKQGNKKDRITLDISNCKKQYSIGFYKVTKFCIDSACAEEQLWFGDTYRYDEWNLLADGRIKYSLITAFSKTITFECAGVIVNKNH